MTARSFEKVCTMYWEALDLLEVVVPAALRTITAVEHHRPTSCGSICGAAAMARAAATSARPKSKRRIMGAVQPSMEGLAEGEGFEPPSPCGLTDFKSAAFNRSANPPGLKKSLRGRILAPGMEYARRFDRLWP